MQGHSTFLGGGKSGMSGAESQNGDLKYRFFFFFFAKLALKVFQHFEGLWAPSKCTLTEINPSGGGGGGGGRHSPEKGVLGCMALKTPFWRLSCCSQEPSWGTSPLTRPSFERKMWHFPSKSKHFFRKYDSFQLQKLKFDCNFCHFCKTSVLKPLFLMKICSQAPTFMAIYPLTRPQVRKSGWHIPTRKKSWVPPSDQYSVVNMDQRIYKVIVEFFVSWTHAPCISPTLRIVSICWWSTTHKPGLLVRRRHIL